MRLALLLLLAGCTRTVPAGTLSVDIRGSVDVAWTGGDKVDLSGFRGASFDGLIAPSLALARAPLSVEEFPEAATTLYAATLSGGPHPSGPCGAEPVTLALALVRREGNRRVSGALTAYCGSNRTPARILRLGGELAVPPAR